MLLLHRSVLVLQHQISSRHLHQYWSFHSRARCGGSSDLATFPAAYYLEPASDTPPDGLAEACG